MKIGKRLRAAVGALASSVLALGAATIVAPQAGATLPEGKAWNNGYQIGEDQNSMNPGNMPGQVNSAVEVKTDGKESADGTQEWTISWNNYPVLSNQPNQHAWPRSPWLTFALSKNLQIEGNIEWTLESTDAWTRKMGKTVGVQQSVSPNVSTYSGGQFLGIWDSGTSGTKNSSFANGDPGSATDGAILKYLRNGNNVYCLRDNSSPCNATVLETADNNFSDGQKSGPLPFLKWDENSNKFFNSGGYVSAVQLLWTGGTNDYGRAAHVTAKFKTRRDLNTQIVAGNDQTLPNTWVLGGYKSWYLGNPFFQSIHYKYVGAPVEDSDNDGITDYNEIHVYGTNPNDPDTDDDGLADGNKAVDGLTTGELKAGKDVNNVTRGADGSIIDSNNYVYESSDPAIGKQLPVVLPATVNTTGDKVTHFTGYVSNIAGNLPGSTQPVPKRYTVEVRYKNNKVASGLTNADGSFDLVAGQGLKSLGEDYHNNTVGNSYELEDDAVGDPTKAVPKVEPIQGLESSLDGTNPSDWTIKIWSDGWDGRPIFTNPTEMGWVTEPEPFDNYEASFIDPSKAFATTGNSLNVDGNGILVDIKDENVITVRATLYAKRGQGITGPATIPFTGAAQYLRMQDTKDWRGARFVTRNDDGTYSLLEGFYPFKEVGNGVYEAYITSAPNGTDTSADGYVDGNSAADFNITYTGGSKLKGLAGPKVTGPDGTVYPAAPSGYFEDINYTWTSDLPDHAAITVDGEQIKMGPNGAATVPANAVKLTAYLNSDKGENLNTPAGQRYVWVKYPGQDNLVKTLLDKDGSFTYPGSVDITDNDRTIKVYNSQDGAEKSLIGTHVIDIEKLVPNKVDYDNLPTEQAPATVGKPVTGLTATVKDQDGKPIVGPAVVQVKVPGATEFVDVTIGSDGKITIPDYTPTSDAEADNHIVINYNGDEISNVVVPTQKATTPTSPNTTPTTTPETTPTTTPETTPTTTPANPGGSDTTTTPPNPGGSDTTTTPANPGGSDTTTTPANPGGSDTTTTPANPGGSDTTTTPANPDGGDSGQEKTVTPSVTTATVDENGHVVVTGSVPGAGAGTAVTVTLPDGTKLTGTTNADDTFTVEGDPQTPPTVEQSVSVTAQTPGKTESDAAQKALVAPPAPPVDQTATPENVKAVVNSDGTVTVTGSVPGAGTGTAVEVTLPDGTTVVGETAEGGSFEVTVTQETPVKPGDDVTVSATEPGKTESEPVTVDAVADSSTSGGSDTTTTPPNPGGSDTTTTPPNPGGSDTTTTPANPGGSDTTTTPGGGTTTPTVDKEDAPKNVEATRDPATGNTTVTGESDAPNGTKVTVKDKDGNVVGEGTVQGGEIVGEDGNPIVVPDLQPNDTVQVTVGEGETESDPAIATVSDNPDQTKTATPVVTNATVTDNGHIVVTGSVPGAVADTAVEVTLPDGTKLTGKTKDKGEFTIEGEADKTAPKAGDKVSVIAQSPNKTPSDAVEKEITNAPKPPVEQTATPENVKVVVDDKGDVTISGTVPGAAPGTAVTVTLPDGTKVTGTTGKDGVFNYTVTPEKPVKPGDKVTVTATEQGKTESDPATATVQNPAPTNVDATRDPETGDTTITGDSTAPDGTKVTVKDENGNTIGEGTVQGGEIVGEDGNPIVVPGLKPGETVTVTVGEGDQESDPATATVKDNPDQTKTSTPVLTGATVDEDGHVEVTGSVPGADAGTAVTVTLPDDTKLTGTTGEGGKFTVAGEADTTAPKVGDKVSVTAQTTGKAESDAAEKPLVAPPAPAVEQTTTPENVKVVADDNGNVTISGTVPGAASGTTVTVTLPDGTKVTGTTGSDGTFTFTVTPDTPVKPGDTVTVTATEPGKSESKPTTATVQNPAPTNVDATRDPETGDTTIIGDSTAPNGTKVTVKDKDGKTIGEGKVEGGKIVDNDGNPIVVPGLNPNDKVEVTVGEGETESDPATATVKDNPDQTKTADPSVTSATVTDNGHVVVTGSVPGAGAGTTVTVTLPDGTKLIGQTNDKGEFTIEGEAATTAPTAGQTVSVTAQTPDKTPSDAVEKEITNAPKPPVEQSATPENVKVVVDDKGDVTISGTVPGAAPGTAVTVTLPGGTKVTGTTGENGVFNFTVTPKTPVKPGDEVTVTATEQGKTESEPVTATVTNPAPTNVDATRDPETGDTTITGESDAPDGTKVTVKDEDGNTIGEGTVKDGEIVGEDGNPIVVPGLEPGDTIQVTVGEGDGESDPAVVTVEGPQDTPTNVDATRDPESGETTITGDSTAPDGTKVTVKDEDGNVIGEGKVEDGKIVGSDGKPLVIDGLKDGDKVSVTVGEGDSESNPAVVTVADDTDRTNGGGWWPGWLPGGNNGGNNNGGNGSAGGSSAVADPYNVFVTTNGNGVTVSGTTTPGATVTVTLPDGSTVTTTADANGNFSVEVPGVKAGDKLTIQASKDGQSSAAVTVEVPGGGMFGGLASTGASGQIIAMAAAVLMAGGLVLLVAARRRKNEE